MIVLIVYDSVYENTEKIAKAIGEAITGEVRILRVDEVGPTELESIDLLIVGSPTQGGKHTKAIQEFLDRIPDNALRNVSVAAFDTRLTTKLLKVFGYAAGRIADGLKDKGGILIASAEGFFVHGTKGPLLDGELARVTSWAKLLSRSKK